MLTKPFASCKNDIKNTINSRTIESKIKTFKLFN